MKIGEKIKEARKRARLTQVELAEKLECSQVMISAYEKGLRNPKLETLQKIADALEIPLILLVEDDLLDAATFPYDDSEEQLIDKKINDIMNNTEMSLDEKRVKTQELMTQLKILENYHLNNVNNAYNYMFNKLLEQLNFTGKDKALEHIEMLTKIPEYRQDTNPEKN